MPFLGDYQTRLKSNSFVNEMKTISYQASIVFQEVSMGAEYGDRDQYFYQD